LAGENHAEGARECGNRSQDCPLRVMASIDPSICSTCTARRRGSSPELSLVFKRMSEQSPTSSSETPAPANTCAGVAQTFAIRAMLGSRIDFSIVLREFWALAALEVGDRRTGSCGWLSLLRSN
jgi:hypothetical protein